MSCGGTIDTTSRQNRSKNLIRSKYADIMIKVDSDVYHLDRLQLACKSDYFEKLFIEDFREKKIDFLELPVMDSDTFSTVVDIIYGQKFNSALNDDNYVFLLMAMDYLQMKIDLRVYGKFIKNFIEKKPSLDEKMFKLCEYVAENRNFDDLLRFVYTCLSVHLAEVRNHEAFLSLPLDHAVGIISGQRYGFRNVDDIFKCSRICVEWIFHDVENRLPHAVKLVNAVRCRLMFPYQINDEDFSVKMRNAGEEITSDSVLRYFIKMVAHQGEIGVSNVVMQKSISRECEYYDYSSCPEIDQHEVDKLVRFLENGDFHDIVVQVEGKTYKLHRCKLLSDSGYFAQIFSNQPSKPSDQPKNDDYLLDVEGVTQTTFDVSIRYIYHKKIDLNSDIIFGVLKTASVLKIDTLLDECESWIKDHVKNIQFETVVEILNFIRQNEKIRLENMYKYLLCKRILKAWSEGKTHELSPFCAISIDMLEDLLIPSALHVKVDESSLPADFCISDPHKLLDMCSIWVIDDIQNRYKLIPRIALAINCNRTLHYNDYKMEAELDLSNCSRQHVKDQLFKVLSSTSLISRDEFLKRDRELKNEPVFIAENRTKICILNAQMDEIVSLWLYNDNRGSIDYNDGGYSFLHLISATTIGDNLFIAANILDYFQNRIFFLAYHISSKKFTFLACPPFRGNQGYELLNCRGDVYCVFINGMVLKYLMNLNRWMLLVRSEGRTGKKKNIKFASDGKTLYRMYETVDDDGSDRYRSTNKFFESYDFDGNSWVSVLELASAANNLPNHPTNLMIVNEDDIAVLYSKKLYIFDRNSSRWRRNTLPAEFDSGFMSFAAITQCESGLLFMKHDKLYRYQVSNSEQMWKIEKDVVLKCGRYESYDCLAAVHRPDFRLDNILL